MKDLQAFQQFSLGKENHADLENFRTVVYSRVSTKGQEDNTSLANQYETCMRYVEREKLEVVAEFGGKGESAKTGSARKEYERMLKYVMDKRNRIRFVVFYAYDRFSREGGKAIVTKEKLKSIGILVKSATMPIDTSNPYGEGMEDMQLIFAKIENDIRRNRAIDGMRSKLRSGHWCGTAPTGYKWDNGNLTVDPVKGPLVKKVFKWKYENPLLSPKDIKGKLEKLGMRVGKNTVAKILRNPFYCGLIANKLLKGNLVEGKHEHLVSRKVFLAVNEVLENQYPRGWKHNDSNYELLPLKKFMVCDCCGTPLTGYVTTMKNGKARKNPLPYYKCRTTGCLTNINANKLGVAFLKTLKQFSFDEDLVPLISQDIRASLIELNAEKFKEAKLMEGRLNQINLKLERLRERFVMEEEISRDDYGYFCAKLQSEKEGILKELEQTRKNNSNLLDHIEESVKIASQIAQMWKNGNYAIKQRIQKLAFPEGMYYSKENDTVRTPRVNEFIRLSGAFGSLFGEKTGSEKRPELAFPTQASLKGTDPGV